MLILNAALVTLIFLETVAVMVMWERLTGGGWRRWPAGRSLMGLLACIAGITGLAATALWIPGRQSDSLLFSFAYLSLVIALFHVGRTILNTQKSRPPGKNEGD